MTSPTVVAPVIKPGFKTSEFWVSAVAPIVLSALALIFHRDFSSYVPAAALVMSGLAGAVYAVSRAGLKRPVDLASLLYDVKALLPIGKDVVEVATEVKVAAPKKAVVKAP